MAETLTMMAVHAHPDDEASSTGGVLASYADQGIRTVVVTCTNGEFGDAQGGVKPGQDGHDEQAVEAALARARDFGGPVLVHVITRKGFGYALADGTYANPFYGDHFVPPGVYAFFSDPANRKTSEPLVKFTATIVP